MAEGLTMLLAGNADGALSKFDVALGFDPNDTDALFHIAEVATANDNFDKADQALQKCFKVDDRNPSWGWSQRTGAQNLLEALCGSSRLWW